MSQDPRATARRAVRALLAVSLAAAAGLFVFLAVACPDAQAIGLVPAALWVPLILWTYNALGRRRWLVFGFSLPVSALVFVATILLTCPGTAGGTALVISLVGFLVYAMVLAAGTISFEELAVEDED